MKVNAVCIKQAIQLLIMASFAIADAPVKANSPDNAMYVARFNNRIEGTVEFSSTSNHSVRVDVNLSGLPSSGGPFPYHVHVLPVPSDGDCYGTLGHLNPYNGSESAESAAEKEVGDLSGKHGAISGQSFETSYIEQYLSLNVEDPAFVGNRSVVIHYANDTRIACANITFIPEISNNTHSSISSANAAVSNFGKFPLSFGAVAAVFGLLI